MKMETRKMSTKRRKKTEEDDERRGGEQREGRVGRKDVLKSKNERG